MLVVLTYQCNGCTHRIALSCDLSHELFLDDGHALSVIHDSAGMWFVLRADLLN